MSYRLEIRPEALADIAGAAAWYEERESGLGERFTREVISGRGGAFRKVSRTKLFTAGAVITIAAVIHASRQEWHWMARFEA